MRHGDRFSEPLDPPLTPKGLRQSRQLAELLASEPPIDAIFCSPWLRALQTIAPLANARGLPIRVERGFGEYLPEQWPVSPVSFSPLQLRACATVTAGLNFIRDAALGPACCLAAFSPHV